VELQLGREEGREGGRKGGRVEQLASTPTTLAVAYFPSLPPSLPPSFLLTLQIFNPETGPGNRPRSVPINTAFSNVLYLYPLSLDKSQYRNLTIKVGKGGREEVRADVPQEGKE